MAIKFALSVLVVSAWSLLSNSFPLSVGICRGIGKYSDDLYSGN